MKKYYAIISCGVANPLYKKEVEVYLTGYKGRSGSIEVTTAQPHLMPQCTVNIKTNKVTNLPGEMKHYTGWAESIRLEEEPKCLI